MPRIHAPITSFGAELQEVLRKGADKQIEITFPNKQLATRFKQRIHSLRVAMKAANHPDWQQLYRCAIYQDQSNPCKITVGPKDSEFREVLRTAGINAPEPSTVTQVEVSDPQPGSVDSFLADLTSVTSVKNVLNEDSSEPEPDVGNL